MEPAEILYWREYLREPRGERRADYHAAQITQAVYSVMSAFAKNAKPISMSDCLLKFEDSQGAGNAKGMTLEQAMQTVAAIAASFGKKSKPFTRKLAKKLEGLAKPAVDTGVDDTAKGS